MSKETLKADCDLLLLGGHRIQAAIDKLGPIARQHLHQIRLLGAFALTDLFGAALFGGLAVFGRNFAGIDERLGSGRRGGKQGDSCYKNELLQMSLRKGLILAPDVERLNGARWIVPGAARPRSSGWHQCRRATSVTSERGRSCGPDARYRGHDVTG